MKKLLLLIFSLILSVNSYAEWTKVLPGNSSTLYIDFKTLKEEDGFINWWYIDSWSTGSAKSYAQGDCDLKGFRILKRVDYSFPMGEGEGTEKDMVTNWEYYQANTGYEILLNFICQMSKLSPQEQSVRIEILEQRNEEFERENLGLIKQPEEQISPQLKTLKSAYIDSINSKIKSFWSYQGAQDNWSCVVLINQAENGAVEGVKVVGCDNGNNENPAMSQSKALAFSSSIRRAVFKSSPLPSAPDEAVFSKEIMLTFKVN